MPPTKRTGRSVLVIVLGLALWSLPGHVEAQFDDFNDGDDHGWTRISPLALFGVSGVFTVTNGGYRIQTIRPSPNPAMLGPPRAYSLRRDVVYTDFYESVDLVKWRDDLLQGFGLAARVSRPGLGSSLGYAFTYNRSSATNATAQIWRVTGESPTTLPTGPGDIHLDPAKAYRLVFIGKGSQLEGRIFELPNTTTPVLVILANDGTYTNGWSGFLIYDNSGGTGMSDATFDNYLAACVEPPQITCPTVDQQQGLTDTNVSLAVGGSSEQRLAQVVTIGLSGWLTGIQLPVLGCGSGDLTVEIQGVINNIPDGVVLASQTVPGPTLPMGSAGFQSVAFPTPVFLTACSRVSIVLRSTGSCEIVAGPAGDAYAGGDAFFDARPNPPVWLALGRDLAFRTVVGKDLEPPMVTCPGPITRNAEPGACNALISFAATAADNCSARLAYDVAGTPITSPHTFPVGTTTVHAVAIDSASNSADCTFDVTVADPLPVVSLTGPESGSVYAVNTPVSFSATFTDAGGGTHSGTWMFDHLSQPATIVEPSSASPGSASAIHIFAAAGVYKVRLIINDSCGSTGSANQMNGKEMLVVVYDPAGGFVTGGGWMDSPPGAYVADPGLRGKAAFGFVSKYQKGATVPTGETEFEFKAAKLKFHASSYEWLVISGSKALYKATGQLNGAGNYGFLLTASDGRVTGGGGVDKLRIKIWDINNQCRVVYDNVPGEFGEMDGANLQPIGGGSIVIHK